MRVLRFNLIDDYIFKGEGGACSTTCTFFCSTLFQRALILIMLVGRKTNERQKVAWVQ